MTPPERGVTVCITAADGGELLTLTLDSVKAHTPAEVPVVVLDPATRVVQHRGAPVHGDVVLLEPGCVVAAGWLAGLRDAAACDGAAATVSALTHRDVNIQAGRGFDDDAAVARARSLRLRPRLPAAHGPCVYARRSALNLIGQPYVDALTRADLSRRCIEAGLFHVLADDVLVLDRRLAPDAPIWAGRDGGPAARAAGRIRRAITGLSAVIDARILYGPTTGTHVHVLELVAALARTKRVRLTVILPDDASEFAAERLLSQRGVSLVTSREARSARGTSGDVVHRPFQLSNAGDLTFLRTLGDRLIVTQEDLIAYHNPSYFRDRETAEEHRLLTALALATADRVVFSSSHTRDDAVREDLLDPSRASVVRLGVDHPVAPTDENQSAPARAEQLRSGVQTILCLGTDFHHKNRVFALRMLERLKAAHGWDGVLLLAGSKVRYGSSREQETQLIRDRPELVPFVLDVGAVSEREKAWLFERSALVLYPSVVEGFGFVPFEAAAHRTPCMWAPVSSLAELLPVGAAEIVPWNADHSAIRALALLREDAARRRNLDAIANSASQLTWDRTATQLLDLYEATADGPPRNAAPWGLGAPVLADLGEDAMRLVGPGGELPRDVHRPLLAIATHPRLAAPFFSALKFGYRVSHRLRSERYKRT